jgi:hypothetical protein
MRTTLRGKFFIVLLASTMLLFGTAAHAENITFTKEYTYQASDIDSKVSSRADALQEVKRALLQQLGTYLISDTEVKNYKMTKDQITTLTAGIVSAEILQEKWDGTSYYLRAKLTVDPQEVANAVKKLGNDRERIRELEAEKKKVEAATIEAERLRRELSLSKNDGSSLFRGQADYSRAIEDLSVEDWYSGYLFTLKDGATFIWSNYKETGNNYCTLKPHGTVCIQMQDVASIKRGEYPEGAEVISRPAADATTRQRAEGEWKKRQTDNEKTARAVECRRRYAQLQQERNTVSYDDRMQLFRADCSGVDLGVSADDRAPRQQSSPSYQSSRPDDTDRIMKNAVSNSNFNK